jgi:hypothetical protein
VGSAPIQNPNSGFRYGGSVTINSLPSVPTVSVDKTILPSSGGSVSFSVTPGASNDST